MRQSLLREGFAELLAVILDSPPRLAISEINHPAPNCSGPMRPAGALRALGNVQKSLDSQKDIVSLSLTNQVI